MNPIKVLIVDDSKLIQSILTDIIDSDPRFTVVGNAINPYEARTLVKESEPDVLTLDVEMPKMNGLVFLKNLMRLKPMPVVMISTLTAKGASVTLEALEYGALDFVKKPSNIITSMDEYAEEIREKIYNAAHVSRLKLLDFQQKLSNRKTLSKKSEDGKSDVVKLSTSKKILAHKVCAIGGSTGGLEALAAVLSNVSYNGTECIVVCLHLPGGFTESFARRLNEKLPICVKEGEHGEVLHQGHVYIAPGGLHMEVKKRASHYYIEINDGEPVSRHKPSVDVLLDSVASSVGSSAIGMILTGMGQDGAEGLKNMCLNGCRTYIQNEETSVVWGMPGSALKVEAVVPRDILSLIDLGKRVTQYYQRKV